MMNVINTIDCPIEATSPFAVYPDETLKKREIETPCFVRLTELDNVILTVLGKYHILTSALITLAIAPWGLENGTKTEVQKRLKLLVSGKYVTQAYFESPTGSSVSKCYTLDYRGRGYLKYVGQRVKLASYLATLDHVQYKKILAANQYIIRTNTDVKTVRCCTPVYATGGKDKQNALVFRPQGTINAERTTFVEAVRGDDLDFSAVCEKLQRMDRTLRKKKQNLGITNPQVVLVCESTALMESLMRRLRHAKYRFELKFTADPLVYADPENCIRQMETKPAGIFGWLCRKSACF